MKYSLFFLFLTTPLFGAEPAIRNLNLRGLQLGGTTTIVMDGDDFGKTPRLLLPFPAQEKLNPKSTDKQAIFDITLGADISPGYYNLRVLTEEGVSNPMLIAVDRFPQKLVSPNPEPLPVALHGTLAGSQLVEVKILGKGGQKLMAEVEAQRLGGKLRPIIHLTNSKKIQLAWGWGKPGLAGDCRLEAVLPEEGTYTITIHDVEYAGQAPGFFRLRLGEWSFVDQVFPPVIAKGQKTAEWIGMGPVKVIDIPNSPQRVIPLSFPKEGLWSGPRPFVRVSPNPELLEHNEKGKIQDLPAGSSAVSGKLSTPMEEDRYRIPVQPRQKIRFEVFAERIGSSLDCALAIRDDKDKDLVKNDDSPGTLDPALEYTVPEKTTAIIVAVIDAQGRGHPNGIYRLTIDPVSKKALKAGLQLSTTSQKLSIPEGGTSLIPVLADRRGYQGPIEISASGLPPGVKVEGAAILPGSDGALVTVHRGSLAAGQASLIHWQGKNGGGDEIPVVIRGNPLEKLQPWLATEIALAPSKASAKDFQIEFRKLAADAGWIPSVKFPLGITVKRPDPLMPVKLSLLTTQLVPLVNNQPDPAKAIRLEKVVEVPAKMSEVDLTALVPPILTSPFYDLAIQAEFLTPDKKSILATTYTPVRRLAVKYQMIVKLETPTRMEAALDPKTGTKFALKGKVERREGLKEDITLNILGLPPGVPAPPVTLKGGTEEFKMDVQFPPTILPGEYLDIKIFSSAAPDPKQAAVKVNSLEVNLTLVVKETGK